MKTLLLIVAAACVLSAQDPSWRNESSLFWPQEKRDIAYRNIEKIYRTNTVVAGPRALPLLNGRTLSLKVDVDAYIRDQSIAGMIILHQGKIVLEKYSRSYDAGGRWLSQSVAKSVTSILAGAAIQDGFIKSVEDPVTKYLPEMKGSGYDGVTLRQLLTMTSGVKWNEDYTDSNSDNVKFFLQEPEQGLDATVAYMRKLPRDVAPGSKWVYKTGETNLIGVLLARATGKKLADYLSEKVWKPFGMERDAVWQLSKSGVEISGCCMAIALRDYARLGLFVLGGGKANGQQVVEPNYLREATSKQADIGATDGRGYGFQWWTLPDGSFYATGIFGQGLFLDPKRQLVMAVSGNWPVPTDRVKLQPQRFAFFKAVQAAVAPEPETLAGVRTDFEVAGKRAFLITPKGKANGAWLWYAPTLGNYPNTRMNWLFNRLLAAGVSIGGIDVGESYGNQAGRKVYTELAAYLEQHHRLQRPCLLGQSRGGLMQFNWAADHPEKVRCLVGIYPVLDPESWPGLDKKPIQAAHEVDSPGRLRELLPGFSPMERMAPIAAAHVPVFLIHGDSDVVVPAVRNSILFEKKYRALGGDVTLVQVPGKGHQEVPEFFESEALLAFLLRQLRH